MLLEHLAEVIYIGKSAFHRDFLNFIHTAVQHAFCLVEPYQRQILPECLTGFLFEEISEIERTEIDHLSHFSNGKRFKVMIYHMLQYLFYALVIVSLVITVTNQLVIPLEYQHEDRSCLGHIAGIAHKPGCVQLLVKGNDILPYADM
jgi:hypothetical protein